MNNQILKIKKLGVGKAGLPPLIATIAPFPIRSTSSL